MDFFMPDAVDVTGLRRLPIVHDERFDHYPEFGAALVAAWGVDPGATRARRFYRASGVLYEVRVQGNERGFPVEADLAVWLPAYASLDADAIDAGAWTFLAWLLRAAGGEWHAVDPDRFARRFGVPVEAGRARYADLEYESLFAEGCAEHAELCVEGEQCRIRAGIGQR